MADIVNPQITDAVAAENTNLGPAVASALKLAMENAVNAQQQLNQIGIAALTQALSIRLSASSAAATDDPAAKEAPAAENSVAAAAQASILRAGGVTPANAAVAWARAFAEGLALIDAATAQHMREIVTVILMAQVDTKGASGPVNAVLIEDLLKGNALAETILALKTVHASTDAKA